MSMIQICEKCNEIEVRPWLLLDLFTEVPNKMRRKVWIVRTCFMWRMSWRIVLLIGGY